MNDSKPPPTKDGGDECYDLGTGELAEAQEELSALEHKKLLRKIDLK